METMSKIGYESIGLDCTLNGKIAKIYELNDCAMIATLDGTAKTQVSWYNVGKIMTFSNGRF